MPPHNTLTGHYELDQNGITIASGNALQGQRIGLVLGSLLVQAGLSSRPATIRFVLTAARTGPAYPLSTASQTVWTWRSAPHPGAKLPKGWTCPSLTTPTQSCSVEPMMTLLYNVRGLAVDGSAPAGPQQVQITAGHLQLAPAATVTRATAQFSVDNGKTWQPASVTPTGGGRFNVTFTAPPGAYISLRVHAADAAGGQITETITRGYQTTDATSHPGASLLPPPAPGDGPMRAACPAVRPGQVRCFALFAPQDRVNAAIAAGVSGAGGRAGGMGRHRHRVRLQAAGDRQMHQTVAVVDAYSTPKLAANLAVYRKQYGLPPCTTASGCLRIVNQQGKAAPLPKPTRGGVRVGRGDHGRVDGVGRLPALQDPGRGGLRPQFRRHGHGRGHRGPAGRTVISNSYGARETGLTQSLRQGLRPPWARHRGRGRR